MTKAALRLLHGTSSDRLGYIFDSKEIPGEGRGLREPYLTDLLEVAQEAAALDASLTHTDPVILEVEVDDPGNLRADYTMSRMPMVSVLKALGFDHPGEYVDAVKAGQVLLPKDDRDWETSLATVHSVLYTETIPFSKIRVRSPKALGSSGTPELGITYAPEEQALIFEDAVRRAFVQVYGPPYRWDDVPNVIYSSYLEAGRRTAWTEPKPNIVVVSTENPWLNEPYTSEKDNKMWGEITDLLESVGWTGAGWESINPAVHYIYWMPEEAEATA